ncbi:MAG: energy transducer TonB [Burkholderiales bacterium]|nr:energy transducer TonB [Burkholderiales bacterium]
MEQLAKRVAPPAFDLSSLGDWSAALLRRDPQTRFQAALLLSLLLHLFVVVGVSVRAPERSVDVTHAPLMVDLVNSRTAAAPQKAEILAQANLDGGGNTDADRRAKSPLPMVKRHDPEPDVAVKTRTVPAEQLPAPRVMTQSSEPAAAVAPPEVRPQTEPQPEPAPPSAADLINSSREMVQLQAHINRSLDAYQKRPRRTFIGARAKEFRFSRYIEDWRTKIERVGEMNYPAAARGIYGNLQVSVSIRADGSLEGAEISRSSGRKVLDEAAIRIVRLASPFAPFPPDIAQDTDILSITRTWSFTRADQFQAE